MNEGNADSNSSTTSDQVENEIPEKFKLDRKKIQTATLVDENDELNQLGVSVFNQADLERGLIDQVDNVVSNQERQHKSAHIEKQIQTLEQSISSLRSNISAKQQILATIDRATYLASRRDVQKANIEKTIKELVRFLRYRFSLVRTRLFSSETTISKEYRQSQCIKSGIDWSFAYL